MSEKTAPALLAANDPNLTAIEVEFSSVDGDFDIVRIVNALRRNRALVLHIPLFRCSRTRILYSAGTLLVITQALIGRDSSIRLTLTSCRVTGKLPLKGICMFIAENSIASLKSNGLTHLINRPLNVVELYLERSWAIQVSRNFPFERAKCQFRRTWNTCWKHFPDEREHQTTMDGFPCTLSVIAPHRILKQWRLPFKNKPVMASLPFIMRVTKTFAAAN